MKIDFFKAPRDKIISIINCCKIVSSMIWKSKKQNKTPTGADEFLSVLIFVLIKTKPKKLASNIAYIRDFRGNGRLNGEDEYYLVTF